MPTLAPTGRRPRPGQGSRGPGYCSWGWRPRRKGGEWAPSPQARLPASWCWPASPGLLAWFLWLLALDFGDLLALPVDTGTSEQLRPLAALRSEDRGLGVAGQPVLPCRSCFPRCHPCEVTSVGRRRPAPFRRFRSSLFLSWDEGGGRGEWLGLGWEKPGKETPAPRLPGGAGIQGNPCLVRVSLKCHVANALETPAWKKCYEIIHL